MRCGWPRRRCRRRRSGRSGSPRPGRRSSGPATTFRALSSHWPGRPHRGHAAPRPRARRARRYPPRRTRSTPRRARSAPAHQQVTNFRRELARWETRGADIFGEARMAAVNATGSLEPLALAPPPLAVVVPRNAPEMPTDSEGLLPQSPLDWTFVGIGGTSGGISSWAAQEMKTLGTRRTSLMDEARRLREQAIDDPSLTDAERSTLLGRADALTGDARGLGSRIANLGDHLKSGLADTRARVRRRWRRGRRRSPCRGRQPHEVGRRRGRVRGRRLRRRGCGWRCLCRRGRRAARTGLRRSRWGRRRVDRRQGRRRHRQLGGLGLG